jgi:hypothetical protein
VLRLTRREIEEELSANLKQSSGISIPDLPISKL